MTSSPSEFDVDHLRSWIGREEEASDVITADLARIFHATFDLPCDTSQIGKIAPRLIHFCLAQSVAPTAALGEDGHPQQGGFLPPVPLPRRMWAGGSLSFHRDLHIGETIHRVSRIADVVAKDGRTVRLCFVAVEHELGVDGQVVLTEAQNIVYCGLGGGKTEKVTKPAKVGSYQRRIVAPPLVLFRYSALTFNGHRIHYDHRYVTEVENYPKLVVHDPMQATLLLSYATELPGSPPSKFVFRSHSPLFEGEILLNADEDGENMKLWTASEDDPIAMTAEASWQ